MKRTKRGALTREEVMSAKANRPDGNGLTLNVQGTRRFWTYRFTCPLRGEQQTMVLGHVKDGLEDPDAARDLRDAARLKIRAGFNPKEERSGKLKGLGKVTFGAFAEVNAERLGSKSGQEIFIRDVTTKVGAVSDLHPAAITVDHVADALRPYWVGRQPTAQRLRRAIETVWFAAQADGLIPADATNPALKKGPLQHKLKKLPKRRVKHFPALPWPSLPAFLARLRVKDQMSNLALEWIILTASRSNEVCQARWQEIDLKRMVWTVPAEHLKGQDDTDGDACERPITRAMCKILIAARPPHRRTKPGDLIFPNPRGRKKKHYVPNSIWQLLQHYKLGEPTVHGFRSTFADWAKEAGYSREWVDLQLAHAVGDETSSAYQRSKLLELRRPMMKAFSEYCAAPAVVVAPLRLAA
jgi:integrase